MKKTLIVLAMSAFLAAPALADESPAAATVEASAIAAPAATPVGTPVQRVREGQSIYTVAGDRIGTVNRVTERGSVIIQGSGGRFVSVAMSSLTRVDGRILTSQSVD